MGNKVYELTFEERTMLTSALSSKISEGYDYIQALDNGTYYPHREERIEKVRIKIRKFEDLIGDFYQEIYGCEISEEEMAVMRMAGREAGVFHEAD